MARKTPLKEPQTGGFQALTEGRSLLQTSEKAEKQTNGRNL